MRTIINGKMYDTKRAECIGSYNNSHCRSNINFYEEELYKTKKR